MPTPVRILYIDDDAGLGRLLQKALKPQGFLVHHVETGEQALTVLGTDAFDVIALDHNLGHESGLDLIPKIQRLPNALPIIYVTGSDDARVAVAALKAGAVDYVWKDVQGHYRELLGEAIGSALEQQKLIREKEEAEHLVRKAKERAELLLDEVNHRVANSLSLVAAMVRMQANAVTDDSARQALQETQARIAAIAGVHRRLYTSSDVRFVAVDAYINSLIEELGAAMSVLSAEHKLHVQADADLEIPTDKVVSLGVIVTELVTNAYKYAYPKNTSGRIAVVIRRMGDKRVALSVEDDGVGWNGIGAVQGTGLGSRIIKAMATNLGAAVVYAPVASGTRAVLEFDI